MHRPPAGKKGCSTVNLIIVAALMLVMATLIGFAAVWRGGGMMMPRQEPASGKPRVAAGEAQASQASDDSQPATLDATPSVNTPDAALIPSKVLEKAPYDVSQLRAAAKLLNSELLGGIPTDATSFNTSFINPCWADTDGKTQCLPHFILAGGFHSGARGLAHALTQHPDIVTAPSSNSQFWAEDGKTMSEYLKGWQQVVPQLEQRPGSLIAVDVSASTFAFYMAAGGKAHRPYASSFKSCYDNCTSSLAGQKDAREACVANTCYQQAWRAELQAAEQTHMDYYRDHHVPMLMRAVYGSRPPKIAAVVRDPVERLHSAFYGYDHYHGKYGAHPQGFLAYVKEQVGAFKNCTSLHDPTKCALYFEAMGAAQEKVYFHCDQLLRGMYAVYMEVWMRFFPSNFMLIQSEHYFEEPAASLQLVAKHAGIQEAAREQVKQWFESYTIPRHVKGRPMLKEARQILYDFYKPWNQRLAEITGMKQFLQWNAAQEAALAKNEGNTTPAATPATPVPATSSNTAATAA